MFNVASTAPLQGGGLGGGGGMNFGVGQQTSNYSYADSDTVEYVTDLLQQFVEPDSWQDNGGSSLIVPMNQSLLIRAPEDSHRKIRGFLNELTDSISGGQPLQVEAWWLPLNPGERRRLTDILNVGWNDKDKATAAVKDLAELTETSGGHHGGLRTRSGRTAHTTGGYRRPLIIGSVPNVGTNASAVSPIMTSVNYGIALEITPKLVSAWRDLGKESVKANSERVAINIKTSLTGIGPGNKAKGTARAGEIDRYDIGAQVLEASAVCHIDRPTILGSLAAIGLPPVEGDDENEIFIVIRIRR